MASIIKKEAHEGQKLSKNVYKHYIITIVPRAFETLYPGMISIKMTNFCAS
jgi:hypothetical protein